MQYHVLIGCVFFSTILYVTLHGTYCKDYTSHSRFLQVQVGDRLLSLNGEELMELTSKDCEYTYVKYFMYIIIVHVPCYQRITCTCMLYMYM